LGFAQAHVPASVVDFETMVFSLSPTVSCARLAASRLCAVLVTLPGTQPMAAVFLFPAFCLPCKLNVTALAYCFADQVEICVSFGEWQNLGCPCESLPFSKERLTVFRLPVLLNILLPSGAPLMLDFCFEIAFGRRCP
jgi:hypothetical protein